MAAGPNNAQNAMQMLATHRITAKAIQRGSVGIRRVLCKCGRDVASGRDG